MALEDLNKRRIALVSLKCTFVIALLAAMYSGPVSGLASEWRTDPSSSYGMLMPAVACYVGWVRRDAIRAIPVHGDNRGIWLLLGGCLLFVCSAVSAGSFLTRVSLLVVIAALVWTFWGEQRFRALAFPLLLLATMIPLPSFLYDSLTAPLQLVSSRLSADSVRLFGVPVYQEGNVIHLRGNSLGVEEACSGLRSLSSLLIVALLLGVGSRPLRRVAIVLAAIPISISSNVLRITGTALLMLRDPRLGVQFYETFSGWACFAFGCILLLMTARLLERSDDGSRV